MLTRAVIRFVLHRAFKHHALYHSLRRQSDNCQADKPTCAKCVGMSQTLEYCNYNNSGNYVSTDYF